jgi:D-alanyl-D-alanine carboxypeptidase
MKRLGRLIKKHKNKKWLVGGLIALIAITFWLIWRPAGLSPSQNYTSKSTQNGQSNTSAHDFNKNLYSINDPSSLWVVVNKGRQLPSNYVPTNLVTPSVPLRLGSADSEMQLRGDVATALEQLFAAANNQNIHLMLASGYRSYSWQASVHNYFVSSQGQAKADATSARPGHSEHQTGLAADIEPLSRQCEIETCFADTPEGQWIAASGYKYGFIIRYQKGKENLSGYEYEPWHIRFVGQALAGEIYNSDQTVEQFFNLPFVPNYISTSFKLQAGR